MDQPCSYEDLRGCLESIADVNRLTQAYHPTLHWLNHMYSILPRQERPLHIVDVGCGYGDFLRRIHSWARDINLPVILTGIDINPDAIRAAREATPPGTATFIACDALDFNPAVAIDLVVNSLLMHHLETRAIVNLLDWMESRARLGWFINDLHRKATPLRLIRFFARFLPLHPFVKHDAAVSILRSFRRADWQAMLQAAAIPESEYLIREYRPARLCVARLHRR
jgi:SAM-dependent methyltransferase